MNHLMVDIESLDVTPSTVHISVGAVVFDERNMLTKFYRNLKWQEQIDNGRTISESTLRWWFTQDAAAREALAKEPVSCARALDELATLYRSLECQRVWANGIVFDIGALESLYRVVKVPIPWGYNSPRDMREMRDEFPEIDMVALGTAHNALDDAIRQATYVQTIWQERAHLRTIISQLLEERNGLESALQVSQDERLRSENIALKRQEFEKRLADARGHIGNLMRIVGATDEKIRDATDYLTLP